MSLNSREPIAEQEVAANVRGFILKSFPLTRKQPVTNSDALLESGKIDSQGILELVAFIEREYSTTVDDEDLSPDNFQTIDRIASFIRCKLNCEQPDFR